MLFVSVSASASPMSVSVQQLEIQLNSLRWILDLERDLSCFIARCNSFHYSPGPL